MKVEIIETLNFPPEIIFAVLTDIPHHVDWVEEPVELMSLHDGPAKLGTKFCGLNSYPYTRYVPH